MPVKKRRSTPKPKVKKKMSRNMTAFFSLTFLTIISGMIIANAFAQDNGLDEACQIMSGDVYSNDSGNRICIKD